MIQTTLLPAAPAAPSSAPPLVEGSWNAAALRAARAFVDERTAPRASPRPAPRPAKRRRRRTSDATPDEKREPPPVLLVWGANGTGKSALVESLVARLAPRALLRTDALLARPRRVEALLAWARDHGRRGVALLDDFDAFDQPAPLLGALAEVAARALAVILVVDDRYAPALRPLRRSGVDVREARLYAPKAGDLRRLGLPGDGGPDLRQARLALRHPGLGASRDARASIFQECEAVLGGGEAPAAPSDLLAPLLFENYPSAHALSTEPRKAVAELDSLAAIGDAFSADDVLAADHGLARDVVTTVAVRAAAHHRGFFRPALRFPDRKLFGVGARSDCEVVALGRKLRLRWDALDVPFGVAVMVKSLRFWQMRALQGRLGLTRDDLALIRELVARS